MEVQKFAINFCYWFISKIIWPGRP